jgi:hypothetical protein
VPCLYVTGTEDDGLVGTTVAAERRVPFDHARAADAYLVVLRGADHMVYGGHQFPLLNGRHDADYQRQIAAATAAFWDAYLGGGSPTPARLADGALQRLLGDGARIETRLRPSPAVDKVYQAE